jgi:hypothetical protein
MLKKKNKIIMKYLNKFNESTELNTTELLKIVSKVLPNISVINNGVYRDGKLLFHSTNNQCVESFLMGMVYGKNSQ